MSVGRTLRIVAVAGMVAGTTLLGPMAALAQPGGIDLEPAPEPQPVQVPLQPTPAAGPWDLVGALLGTGSAGIGSAATGSAG
ncbi:hypothetical protein, partial [Nocardia sp. CC201C]